MKIIPHTTKKVLSVLGLPHSGTTIVSNILNSIDNGFCISEPHWIMLSNPKQIKFDKIKSLDFKNIDDIMPAILRRLAKDSQYDFGGVKETYRPQDPKFKKYLDKILLNSNITVFVFRHPKANYNSLKALSKNPEKNYLPVSRFIPDYNDFYNEFINYKKDKCIIILENLGKGGDKNAITYFNKQSKNIFTLIDDFQLKTTDFIYGNKVAHKSKNINPPNMKTNLLTKQEHDIIEIELMPIYNRIVKL